MTIGNVCADEMETNIALKSATKTARIAPVDSSEMSSPAAWPPPLPLLDDLDKESIYGPTKTSNWVIPGRLIQGAYPGHQDAFQHEIIVRKVLAAGVDVFVCVQTKRELEKRFRPYRATADEMREEENQSLVAEGQESKGKLWYVLCQVPDGWVTEDVQIVRAMLRVEEHLRAGRVVYLHCWGGHGRSGTLTSLLLARMYGLSGEQAMEICGRLHECRRRKDRRGIGSPQTRIQREQVERIASNMAEAVANAQAKSKPNPKRKPKNASARVEEIDSSALPSDASPTLPAQRLQAEADMLLLHQAEEQDS